MKDPYWFIWHNSCISLGTPLPSRSFHSCPSRGSNGSPSHHSSANEDPHPVSGIPERISEEEEHGNDDDDNDADGPVDFSKQGISNSGNGDMKDKMATISILGNLFEDFILIISYSWLKNLQEPTVCSDEN